MPSATRSTTTLESVAETRMLRPLGDEVRPGELADPERAGS